VFATAAGSLRPEISSPASAGKRNMSRVEAIDMRPTTTNALAKSAVCGAACPLIHSDISTIMAPIATPELTDTCWPTLAMAVADGTWRGSISA
jgi:hypothetical protein